MFRLVVKQNSVVLAKHKLCSADNLLVAVIILIHYVFLKILQDGKQWIFVTEIVYLLWLAGRLREK
jgi:hypothetical protein